MDTSHVDEELLAYRVIDLSVLPLLLPTETKRYSDIFLSFTGGKIHEPVELRGEGDFFSTLFFFLWLRRTVPEVCYRQKLGEPGMVVFSIYNRNEKLKPVWMQQNNELSEEEESKVRTLTKGISFEDGKIDIVSVWQEIEKSFPEANIVALVGIIDVLMQSQQKIIVEGMISMAPALAVMNYLIATHKTVVWNGITIQ